MKVRQQKVYRDIELLQSSSELNSDIFRKRMERKKQK
jgi:hypothetical protein